MRVYVMNHGRSKIDILRSPICMMITCSRHGCGDEGCFAACFRVERFNVGGAVFIHWRMTRTIWSCKSVMSRSRKEKETAILGGERV